MDFLSEAIIEAVAFYKSPLFSVIKFLLGIYAIVLFVDMVLLLIQRGLSSDLRDNFLGMNVPAELVTKKNKLLVKWNKVREKLASENESDWKTAIIEADGIIDDLVKRMGYKGDNLGERLEDINPGQVSNIEKLREAHKIKNSITKEPGFQLTRESAREAMENYEEFLKEFEVL